MEIFDRGRFAEGHVIMESSAAGAGSSARSPFCETDSGWVRCATQFLQLEQHREHAFELSVEMNLVPGKALEPIGIDGFTECLSANEGTILQLLSTLLVPGPCV